MSNEVLNYDGIEQRSVAEFTEKAYLDYAMYVILDRALPHIGDGLKPVQRRIIYAMSELGLKASAKYKKSARTVGDVLGKFHPHGDSACYEAMVLMAQAFSFRFPLVDGQGNWGSVDDPKSFAAMRYTEAKLSKFSQLLLEEVGQGTVDWQPNFDGSLDEPKVLPARVPHVLLNGTSGIAVGMATDIPPHNLSEVIQACIALIDQPDLSVAELMAFLPGPDYPNEAQIITSQADLQKMYTHGQGSVRQRARYHLEEGVNVVIDALPYQVSGTKVLEQIAAQMRNKKLPMLVDLRDESDHKNPVRLVVELRSKRIDVEQAMLHLFATTDLEHSYRVNLNVIGLDGRPQVKPLNQMLSEWLQYRFATVRRRLQFRLDKVLARLHILEGQLIAFLNIDEVIAIIREEDHPKAELMARFGLSERQTEAILELKLRQLAKLEEVRIRGEQAELSKEQTYLEGLLGSKVKLKNKIKKELLADAEVYGNPRRSPIVVTKAANALSEQDLLPSEAVTVVLSQIGWVRAAKGAEVAGQTLSYRAGDQFLAQASGQSRQQATFFDENGRCYSLPAHSLPSARSHGEPLTGRLNPAKGANFVQVLLDQPEAYYLLASSQGYGFRVKYADLYSKNKAGKAVLTLAADASLLRPVPIQEDDWVMVVTSEPKMLVLSAKELPVLAKGKGNKLISMPEGVQVNTIFAFEAGSKLELVAGDYAKSLGVSAIESAFVGRAKRGVVLPRTLKKCNEIRLPK